VLGVESGGEQEIFCVTPKLNEEKLIENQA
jgi:hypothetical protein